MIDCLIRQTFSNWELIIVDDQSTDNTPHMVKEYQRNDNRIKLTVRDREPKGSATCRNIGFENTIGDYIMHLDADDLISDTCLEHRVEFMEQNPDIDYTSFPAKSFTNPTIMPRFMDKGKLWGVGTEDMNLLELFLKVDYPFSVWCNIYRKESIEHLSWDENVKIYTDFSFIVTGILAGLTHKFSGLKQVDYYYRQNYGKENMCSTFISPEKCQSTTYLFNKILLALKQSPDYKKNKNYLFNFILLHFERLIMDGDRNKINYYLESFKNYHSNRIIESLKLITCISLTFNSSRLRKGILYLLLGLRFWNMKYIKIILNHLQLS
jgi:glycosyltransferase involved in cell wall biosynthesis